MECQTNNESSPINNEYPPTNDEESPTTRKMQSGARYGVSDSRTLDAEKTCVNAHLLRYGPCTTPVMDTLIDAGV